MGTTNNYNIPFPESTDFVAQGAAAIEAVATGFDTVVKNVEDMIGGSVTTTKGDLIVGDPTGDAVRFGVGTDGHVLTADAAETNGIKWAALPAPPPGGLNLLAANSFSAVSLVDVASVFSATYQHYRVILSWIESSAGNFSIRMLQGTTANTSNNYNSRFLRVTSSYSQVLTAPSTLFRLIETKQRWSSLSMDFFNPFDSGARTTINAIGGVAQTSYATPEGFLSWGVYDAAASFDGFQFFGAGNLTGTVRVYGYGE